MMHSMRPTLTAVMPNFNHAQYIGQAIEAVATQSRPPDEFLIVDDASTDNSVEIIELFARRYPFIRFERNARNLGVLATVSRLLAMASGDYFYSGAADDFILPGFFEKAINLASQFPQAGIIFGKVALVDADGVRTGGVGQSSRWTSSCFASPTSFLREYLEAENAELSLSVATIFKTRCLREIGGFRPELASWADTFAIDAIGLKFGACYVPEVFACFRSVPTSFSGANSRNMKVIFDITARAAHLMRSPEFQDVFPEDYAVKWQQAFPYYVFRQHLHNVCTDAQSTPVGRRIGWLKSKPLIGHFARMLEKAWFKFLVEREKWTLRSYTGQTAVKV